MRVLVVDLLCNSPYYCAPLVRALAAAGAEVELASPEFHLEASALDGVPRPAWLVDLVVHARRPRGLRLAVRSLELSANLLGALRHIAAGAYDVVHVQWIPFEGTLDGRHAAAPARLPARRGAAGAHRPQRGPPRPARARTPTGSGGTSTSRTCSSPRPRRSRTTSPGRARGHR
jgi:hypothetical protein